MDGGQHRAPGLAYWGALAAGVFVAFPSVILPGVADGGWPRTTDLLTFVCAISLGSALLGSGVLHPSIRGASIIWALTLPWAFLEIGALAGVPDPPVQRLLFRWILCGCSAYVIARLVEKPPLRTRFLWGLLIGVGLSSLTVLYDYLTFSPEDMPIDQLVKLAIYDGKDIHDFVYRASGIFGHPNGAAGCVLIGIPVLIGAIEEGRLPRWSVAVGLLFMAAVFYLTKSRGPLLVSSTLVAYWLWLRTKGIRLPLLLAGLFGILGIFAIGGLGITWGNEVLLERFFDVDGISVNASDRWWTMATSLDLLLWNPLGMGSAYVQPLEIATGTSATHNAYLELALMGGIPLTAFVALRMIKVTAPLLSPRTSVEAWLAAYLLGIFTFESYFLQVNIQLMTLWLVIAPLRSIGRRPYSHTIGPISLFRRERLTAGPGTPDPAQ